MKQKLSLLFGIIFLMSVPISLNAQTIAKHRLIVLTDIEADPDDSQTLVRLLLYSNEIDIEGLIATTSGPQKNRVAPETIHKIVDSYGKVQPNLLKHDKDYPAAETLKSLIRKSVPVYGMLGVGEGHDSEGSEWIIKVLEKDDDRPVWVSVWGGPNCLAQALWKIRNTKSLKEAERMYSKLRVYTISDQDDTGPWIRKNFPNVFYIVSPTGYGPYVWGGMGGNIPGARNEFTSNSWIANNIQEGHGPLGAQYPDVAYGMEGDTPSWLGLIPNGLNDMEYPNYGSWGGRYEFYLPTNQQPLVGRGFGPYEPETRPLWTNTDDSYRPVYTDAEWGRIIRFDTAVYVGPLVTLWRWREAYQNDFAARMDWCTMPYEDANHPPVVKLNQPEEFTVKSGEIFKLDADGTYDPDGNSLSYYWFQYPEAGTYPDIFSFRNLSPTLYNVHTITAPEVKSPQTIHFIVSVTDKGTPPLTRYKRVIVTVLPK